MTGRKSNAKENVKNVQQKGSRKRKAKGDHKPKKKPMEHITVMPDLNGVLYANSDDAASNASSIEQDSEEFEEVAGSSVHYIVHSDDAEGFESDSGIDYYSENSGQEHLEEKWYFEHLSEKPQFPFTGKRELKISPDDTTAYGFFSLLFPVEQMENIVKEMNTYAEEVLAQSEGPQARISRWKPLSVKEFKIFLALHYHMGIIRLNIIKDYWRKDYRFSLPFFTKFMTRNRFLLLLRVLHFCNNDEDNGSDRFFKIRPLFDYFNTRMEEIYSVGKELLLDDSNVLWRGKLNSKDREGFEMFVLAEPNGFVQRLLVCGATEDSVYEVVSKLITEKKERGHSLYMNSSCSSIELTKDLLQNETYCTGILDPNRQGIPSQLLETKLKKREPFSMYSEDGICLTKWKAKNELLYISSEFSGDLTESSNKKQIASGTPKLIIEYQKRMKNFHVQKKLLSFHPSCLKSLNWYKKLGLNIFQIILINSYILYSNFGHSKPQTLYEFRLEIIDSLVGGAPVDAVRAPVSIVHLPDPCPRNQKGKTIRRRCKYCWITTKKRKSSLFYCRSCPSEPGLCIGKCFRSFHEYN